MIMVIRKTLTDNPPRAMAELQHLNDYHDKKNTYCNSNGVHAMAKDVYVKMQMLRQAVLVD
ncbi:hypothetical protein ANAPH2_01335 [Anaplasma phagocytophilum]|nr:hypothetical protein ANAPH2_01335 [Anaplasma phagocytophilum]